MNASLPPGPDGNADWAHVSPADLRTYIGLLEDDREAVYRYRSWNIRVLAADDCISRNDWPLQDIFANEAKFVAAAHL